MVRKTQQKHKAKVKEIPSNSERDGTDALIVANASAQSNKNKKQTAKLGCDENTAETSDNSIEFAKFSCEICSQSFKYKTGLSKHQLRHKPPGGFICPECGERFVTDAERLLHKEDIHKIFKCMICNEKCDSENAFVDHINQLHDGRDREYVTCDDCGAQFRQKNQLKLHCKSRCGTVRSFECNQCDAKFMSPNTLNAHMLIHFGEKKHLCNFCGNSFLSRGQLKIHERSHTKERPYKCLVCNKGFAHRESLVTHSSIHTGVKPYMCQCCGQKFSCVGNLIKHRRVRPQSCGLPKYTNAKCAPRASSKVPGSLTLKKEPIPKRDVTRRKIVPVPELLPERVELTKQLNKINIEPIQIYLDNGECKQEPTEMLVEANESTMENELYEFGSHTTSGQIEILEQRIINNPLPYTNSKSSVLLVTNDGNYVITKLDGNISKINEIEVSQPQVKEIIILNGSNDVQLSNVEIDYQPIQQTVYDDSGKIEIIHEAPTAMEHTKEEEEEDSMYEVAGSQYNANIIQHLEIVPAVDVQLDKKVRSIERTRVAGIVDFFTCDICKKQFKQEKSMINHMETKHNMKCDFIKDYVKCVYCSKQYANRNLLQKHMKCHGRDGELCVKCSCCNEYFATKAKMYEHAQREHVDRLKCDYCQKIFKQVDCKTAHIRKMHKKFTIKKTIFVCSKCGKKFNSNHALSDHEQADCGVSPLYKCDHCEKSLHSLGSLKIHQLIHTGDLPFSCTFCSKRFRTAGQVKVHQRSHTQEKPFKCTEPNCTKAFAYRESLLTHLTVHTGVKRFACKGCDFRASCISNLKAHRRTHQDTCGQLPLDTRAQYTFNLDDGSIIVPHKS